MPHRFVLLSRGRALHAVERVLAMRHGAQLHHRRRVPAPGARRWAGQFGAGLLSSRWLRYCARSVHACAARRVRWSGESGVWLRRRELRQFVLGARGRHQRCVDRGLPVTSDEAPRAPRHMVGMTRRVLVLVVLATGCFDARTEGDGGTTLGRYSDAGGSDTRRCRDVIGYSYGTVCVDLPKTVVCRGVTCSAGQECCLTTERCVDPGDTANCPRVPSTWSQPPVVACSVSSDCAADEYCMPDDLRACGGSGHCQRQDHCATCGGAPSVCQVCGCDGRTYESPQHACVAGVAHVGPSSACGAPVRGRPDLISCGADSDCGEGAACCMTTRFCYPLAEAWRCTSPELNCTTDDECVARAAGQGGGPGTENFCRRESCASQAGSCSLSESLSSTCGGEVNTVCGCDGVTYVNSCWAAVARTNVASAGPCP